MPHPEIAYALELVALAAGIFLLLRVATLEKLPKILGSVVSYFIIGVTVILMVVTTVGTVNFLLNKPEKPQVPPSGTELGMLLGPGAQHQGPPPLFQKEMGPKIKMKLKEKFGEEEPGPLADLDLTPEEREELKGKVDAFKEELLQEYMAEKGK